MLEDESFMHKEISAKLTAISADQAEKLKKFEKSWVDIFKIKTKSNMECEILTHQLSHAKQLIETFKDEHKELNDIHELLIKEQKETARTLAETEDKYKRHRQVSNDRIMELE